MAKVKVQMNNEALLDLMKEKGVSQKQAAEAVRVSESHFSRKMSGEYAFTQSEMARLCDILGIADDEIKRLFFCPKT